MEDKEDKEKFYKAAEIAGIFVSKYLVSLRDRGIAPQVMAIIGVNLTPLVIGQLLIDPESVLLMSYEKMLERLDPSGLLPN